MFQKLEASYDAAMHMGELCPQVLSIDERNPDTLGTRTTETVDGYY